MTCSPKSLDFQTFSKYNLNITEKTHAKRYRA